MSISHLCSRQAKNAATFKRWHSCFGARMLYEHTNNNAAGLLLQKVLFSSHSLAMLWFASWKLVRRTGTIASCVPSRFKTMLDFELSCNVSSIYFELQTSLLCAPWVQPQHLPTSAISVVRKSFDARKVRNTPRKTHKPEDRCARACVCVCVCAHARVCSRHHLLVSCSARNVLLACFWEAGATQLLLQM